MSRAETPDASGSALDLRPAVLLDPASASHLYGGEHIRRRGSDIGRLRPVGLTPGPSFDIETIELTTLSRDAAVEELDGDAASKRDLEAESAVITATGTDAAQSLAEDASSAAPFASPLNRRRQRRQAMLCFAALCWCFFLVGWNDGSTGPLLPTIQRHYDVRYSL